MSTTVSRRQFDQDASVAARAAADGPVFIIDGDAPSLVLLSVKDYQALGGASPGEEPPKGRSLIEALAMPQFADLADIDLEIPPRLKTSGVRVPDLD